MGTRRIAQHHLLLVTVVLALLVCAAAPALHADSYRFAINATDSLKPFIAVSELSLLANHQQGQKQMVQGAQAVATATLSTEILKRLTRERRPNGDDNMSFPSGHAAAAFAMAGVIDAYQPKYKILGYAAATVISWSRVELRAHHWHDVVVGAAIGLLSAKKFAHSDRNPQISGLGIQYSW